MPGGIEQGIGGNAFLRSLDANLGAEKAQAAGGNVGSGPVNNSNTINVNGSVDGATAQHILTELDRSNQDLVRNMRGFVQ